MVPMASAGGVPVGVAWSRVGSCFRHADPVGEAADAPELALVAARGDLTAISPPSSPRPPAGPWACCCCCCAPWLL